MLILHVMLRELKNKNSSEAMEKFLLFMPKVLLLTTKFETYF